MGVKVDMKKPGVTFTCDRCGYSSDGGDGEKWWNGEKEQGIQYLLCDPCNTIVQDTEPECECDHDTINFKLEKDSEGTHFVRAGCFSCDIWSKPERIEATTKWAESADRSAAVLNFWYTKEEILKVKEAIDAARKIREN